MAFCTAPAEQAHPGLNRVRVAFDRVLGPRFLRGDESAADHTQHCDCQHRARPCHTRLLLPVTLIHLGPAEWDDILSGVKLDEIREGKL